MSIQPRTGTKCFLVPVASKSLDHLLVQFGECQFPTKVGAERFEKGLREGFFGIAKPDLVAVTFHMMSMRHEWPQPLLCRENRRNESSKAATRRLGRICSKY